MFFNKSGGVRSHDNGGDLSLTSSSEKVAGLCIQDKIIKKGLGGCLGRPKKN